MAFTRWLDAVLADPLTRRDLLGIMLQEHCWLVMDGTERAAYFGEPLRAEGPSGSERAA